MRFFLIASVAVNVLLLCQVYTNSTERPVCPSGVTYDGVCVPEKWVHMETSETDGKVNS